MTLRHILRHLHANWRDMLRLDSTAAMLVILLIAFLFRSSVVLWMIWPVIFLTSKAIRILRVYYAAINFVRAGGDAEGDCLDEYDRLHTAVDGRHDNVL